MRGGGEAVRVLACRCGQVALEVRGEPILVPVCYCESCQKAGAMIAGLPDAVPTLGEDGGTPFVMVRKDRIACLRGEALMAEHRLTEKSSTRRVIATCCNSAMFLEFSQGHWLSLYRDRYAPEERPEIEMRVMTKGKRADVSFGDALPVYATHSGRFMWKLLGAWVAMGFRTPKVDYVRGGAIHGV